VEYAILLGIGLVMGTCGGLVGIGGSVIMIPLMVLFFGENQHLYQASAMLCNVAVALSSLAAHLRARTLVWPVLRWLIPASLVSVLAGVAMSNSSVFAGANSYLLARLFGAYLLYVAALNVAHLWSALRGRKPAVTDLSSLPLTPGRSVFSGLVIGIAAGLFGIGAGTIATPMQQILLRLPIRHCMSNSVAAMAVLSVVGATYKNLTLPQHGVGVAESLQIAALVMPTAFAGGYLGGWLMHRLPQHLVRAVFILILLAAAWELLRIQPAL